MPSQRWSFSTFSPAASLAFAAALALFLFRASRYFSARL